MTLGMLVPILFGVTLIAGIVIAARSARNARKAQDNEKLSPLEQRANAVAETKD